MVFTQGSSEAPNPTECNSQLLHVHPYSKVHKCCCSCLVLASSYHIVHRLSVDQSEFSSYFYHFDERVAGGGQKYLTRRVPPICLWDICHPGDIQKFDPRTDLHTVIALYMSWVTSMAHILSQCIIYPVKVISHNNVYTVIFLPLLGRCLLYNSQHTPCHTIVSTHLVIQ